MKTRVIVGLVGLLFFLIVLLLLPPVATAFLVAAMSAVAVYEMLYQTKLAENIGLLVSSVVMAVAICFWSYGGHPWRWALAGIWIYFFVMTLLLVLSHATLPFDQVCIAMFAGILIPLMLSSLVRILTMEHGKFYIFIPMLLSFGPDTGAYFAGRAFGKHKMAPVVSPKKTWEGAAGGAAAAILGMFLYCLILRFIFSFHIRFVALLLYGVLGTASCVLGDLVFSVIKRQTGIKDYGTLLPGHGGILDRFDSMTLVAPLSETLLLIIPLIVK